MHAIDGPGNVAGQFSPGNPQIGQAATVVSADWLNAVQGELASTIEGAGLALSKPDNAQLLAAIRQLARDELAGQFNTQLSSDGYAVLPGGLILQWGSQTESLPISGGGDVLFPVAFPNLLLQLIPGAGYADGTADNDIGAVFVASQSAGGFSWVNTNGSNTVGIRYLAIGF